MIDWAEKSSKKVFIFLHCNSPAFKFMKQISTGRENYSWTPVVRGEWLEINFAHRETCRAYVAIHKEYFLPKLPDGYELIQGGKKNATVNLGFRGDDTGDNISDLNVNLSELTIHYWVWKNAPKTDYVGFSHYSRFFYLPDTAATDKSKNYVPFRNFHIMTMEEAIDLLQDCDILVRNNRPFATSYNVRNENSEPFKIIKKYIDQVDPKCLETLRLQGASSRLIDKSMFFTRWKVFDEYCKWIFSFMIPAAREWAKITEGKSFREQRHYAWFAEQMTNVFLIQNNLRMKFLTPFDRPKESTPENPAL